MLAAELVNTMVAFSSTVYVRYSSLCLPKYSVLPTVADAAPPHLTLSYYIMCYIASTSINGSRLYYTLPIHSWFSYIQTVSYSIIYWYEQSNIMLAFPSIPCWDWSMIWWGDKTVKEIEAEVWGLHVYSFLCCTKILCAPHCSWCCPHPISLFHIT